MTKKLRETQNFRDPGIVMTEMTSLHVKTTSNDVNISRT